MSVQIDSRALTDEQISTVVEFAEKVGLGLDRAEEDIEPRRRIVEMLGVRATLAAENDDKIACVRCMIDETVLPIAWPLGTETCSTPFSRTLNLGQSLD